MKINAKNEDTKIVELENNDVNEEVMIGEDEMNCVYEDLKIVKNVYNICDSINETYEDDNRNKDNHRNKEKREGIEKDYEDGEKKTSENYIQNVNEIAEEIILRMKIYIHVIYVKSFFQKILRLQNT